MNEEEALHRACFWLCALINAFEVEPATTDAKISISGGGDLVHVNLAEDIQIFTALGVRMNILDDMDREEHYS